MKTPLIILMTLGLTLSAMSQGKETPLWPDGAPGALGQAPHDTPTLTPFLAPADNNSGSAIVNCPGGGYGGLASHEGATYAQFLQKHGINGFVLKYRLGSAGYRHPIMLGDAARAIRTVRTHAEKWKIDPEKIGIMGSSAGGHLAGMLVSRGWHDAFDVPEGVVKGGLFLSGLYDLEPVRLNLFRVNIYEELS